MDTIIKTNISKDDLRIFNNWRLFFQVNCLSELCTVDGSSVNKIFMEYPRDEVEINMLKPSRSKLKWTCQPRPGKKSFNIWTRTLRKCFNISSRGNINVNLGAWYHECATQTNEWLAYHCVTKCSVIITETPGQYREYIPTKSRSNSSTISPNST
jgi:hypothetical protein